MFTEEELFKINTLRKENSDFAFIIDRFNEEQQYMLSSITHELRNPLTLINSTVQLIESKNPEVKTINYWYQLKDDIKDTVLLLQDFSTYNHSDDIILSEVNLLTLIQDLVKSFESFITNRDISITVESCENSLKYIEKYHCDYLKIKQAFTNIIKNAVEAISDSGFIHIAIHADPAKLCKNIDGNTYMIISISNNGQQIIETELVDIFKPFVTFKPCGTGMGLPISYKIISNHGGSIHVSSDEEVTSFQICLPLNE